MELTELKHRPLFFHSNVRGLLCVTAIKEVLQAAESWGVLSCSQDFFCKYQCVSDYTCNTHKLQVSQDEYDENTVPARLYMSLTLVLGSDCVLLLTPNYNTEL